MRKHPFLDKYCTLEATLTVLGNPTEEKTHIESCAERLRETTAGGRSDSRQTTVGYSLSTVSATGASSRTDPQRMHRFPFSISAINFSREMPSVDSSSTISFGNACDSSHSLQIKPPRHQSI